MNDHTDSVPEGWAALWRRDQPPAVAAIQRRVRRAALLNRVATIAEVAVGSAAVAGGLWLVLSGRWLVGTAACIFGGFGLAASLATRMRSPALDTASVAAALDVAIQQVRRQHRTAVGGIWVCVAALVFSAAVALDASGRQDAPAALVRLVRMQAAAGLFVALVLAFVTVSMRHARRRLVLLDRLRAGITDEGPRS